MPDKTNSLVSQNIQLASLLTLIFFWEMPSLHLVFLLLGVGVCGTFHQYFIVLSFTYAPVRLISTLMFVTILMGVFFDWLLWDNIPNVVSTIGMILIIAGSIASVYVGQKILIQPFVDKRE